MNLLSSFFASFSAYNLLHLVTLNMFIYIYRNIFEIRSIFELCADAVASLDYVAQVNMSASVSSPLLQSK